MTISDYNNDQELPIWTSIDTIRAAVSLARRAGRSIGFVPTMGALHDGHAALVRTAAERTDFVVVSIFVNPTQFGPHEDFTRYPRHLGADRAICVASGASGVFHPNVETMYPAGGRLRTWVEVPTITERLEGPIRPGHFRGVATVVLKLLNIVVPDVAFFGEKDYQQLMVVRRMVDDLDLPVEIAAIPTVREPDGLALSSRNKYLSDEQRSLSTALWHALNVARAAVEAGETSAGRVRQILRRSLESSLPGIPVDYAEVADAETLEPLERLDQGRPARALVAVRFGDTRLIDNIPLTTP